MQYEDPFTGWTMLAILSAMGVIGYYGLYSIVWVLKYFWGFV